jgi:tetratricopeptide (TPR) repeat protein
MSNFDRAPLRGITNAALDVALALQPEPIIIKTSIAKTVFKTIASQGVEAAVRQYHDLKLNQPEAYDFRERELNELGYKLIADKKFKEAIAVFQLNVEVYPASSNVYDSLGEAYMLNGEKPLAIKNYEKSLELDPANGNAVEMLKKLKGQ